MKILIDQNISFRLINWIEGAFPNVLHVKSLGLTDTDDYKIFKYARRNNFDAILTNTLVIYHFLKDPDSDCLEIFS